MEKQTLDRAVIRAERVRRAEYNRKHPAYVCAVTRKDPARVRKVPVGVDLALKGIVFLFPTSATGRLNFRPAADRIAAARRSEPSKRQYPPWIYGLIGSRAARVVRMARKRRRGFA